MNGKPIRIEQWEYSYFHKDVIQWSSLVRKSKERLHLMIQAWNFHEMFITYSSLQNDRGPPKKRPFSRWPPSFKMAAWTDFFKCIQDLLVSKVPYAFRNSLFIPINVFQYALRYMFYVPFTKYRNILDGSHL